ncbi:MAG: hypothetical protein ACWA6U_18525, partial [Breznakibacter sp.]
LYILINLIIPGFFIGDKDILLQYIVISSIFSALPFIATNYLKLTRNYILLIIWICLYVLGFMVQFILISNINVDRIGSLEIIKLLRLPIVTMIYSQIFRIIFVLRYNYEPSIFSKADRIGAKILCKSTKNREDYVWFFFVRILFFIALIYLNYKI